jgi:hypothetical protein
MTRTPTAVVQIAARAASVVALCGLCLLAGPAAAEAGEPASEPLTLPAYAPNITGYAGPVSTPGDLPAGQLFVAEVSGAVSYFSKEEYLHPSGLWDTVCGTPIASPEGPLGADAEFLFARPWTSPCPQELPGHWSNFELSTGSGVYDHPMPVGGPFTAPTPGHEYSYALVGDGGPATFRLRDIPDGHPATANNYGALTIRVRGAVAANCAGGDFALFNEPSEGACVTATSLPAEPTPPAATPSSGVLGVKITSPKACVSAREFTIHIQNAKQLDLVSAVVSVDGHAKRTLRGKSLATVIDLRGLPKGTVTVEIVAHERSGRIARGKRVYHTCTSKLRGPSHLPL